MQTTYRLMQVVLFCLLTLALNGCASTKASSTTLHVQQLQLQLAQKEKELEQKETRIRHLEDRLNEAQRPKVIDTGQVKNKSGVGIKTRSESAREVISQPTPKKIQTALKKAGFYNGSIDGKIMDKTKKAIRDFQRANGLESDGIVGKKTWRKLSKYLD